MPGNFSTEGETMEDMSVTILGDHRVAEQACQMVFGENADMGPRMPANAELLHIKDNWPGPTHEPIKVALQLPYNFDISHEMIRNEVKAVTIILCRITVRHLGKKIGYALRTNEEGINGLELHAESWARHRRMASH